MKIGVAWLVTGLAIGILLESDRKQTYCME